MPPRKPPPGNPEWVEWVQELVDKAENNGQKSAQTYKRAVKALQLNPITMNHPDEARSLTGIGQGVVDHLLRELRKKCAREGIPMPDQASPAKKRAPAKKATAATKKRTREEEEEEEDAKRDARRRKAQGLLPLAAPPPARGPTLGFQAHPDGAFAGLPEEVDPYDEEPEAVGTGKGKGKGKRKQKDYIPMKGTGAYAILLAMYKNASYDEHSVPTLKAKIIADARPHSETSFDRPSGNRDGQRREGGGLSYTAWSGMTTLTTKKFVLIESKVPARYKLSEEGYELAERLVGTAGIPKHVYVASPPPPQRGGHPSSSSHAGGAGGSSGSAPFAGRGQTIGGRPANIHPPNYFKQRAQTPPLFLDEIPSDPPRGSDDEENGFDQDLRRAMDLSRKESGPKEDFVARIARETAARANGTGSSRSIGGAAGSSSAFRPAGSTSAGAWSSTSTSNSNAASTSTSTGLNVRRAVMGSFAAPARSEPPQGPSVANVDNAFGYFYLDENDHRTKQRSEAEVTQPGGETYYRIEYRIAQDLHAMVRGLKDPATLNRAVPLASGPGKTKSAYMKGRVSDEVAPGFPETSLSSRGDVPKEVAKKPSSNPAATLLAGYKDPGPKQRKDAMDQSPPEVRRLGPDPFAPVTHSLPIVAPTLKRSITLDTTSDDVITAPSFRAPAQSQPVAGPSRSRASPPPPPILTKTKRVAQSASAILAASTASSTGPLRHTTSQNPLQTCFDPVPGQQIINRHPLDPVRDLFSSTTYNFPRIKPIVWPVGTFKVYLICDTREGMREGGGRIELCERMKADGERVDRKMLPLGDMLWVARKIDPNTGEPPIGKEIEEVVLDAIVERKRMDDLVKSITDGRYLSQKIRLKDSGISHRIYIVENFGEAKTDSLFTQAIKTCKSQIQVNDGFFLYESANVEETINWLKKRTQVMAELYETSEIRIIPDEVIERPSYLALQQHLRATEPAHRYLTTYAMFAELNQSDANLTIRVQWGSMIQRVKGMSAEKAVQFLSRWETLGKFYEEAKQWEIEVEEENRRLDAEERTTGPAVGKGKAKAKKRRRKEDFVVSNLDDVGTRGIKGKLGETIWTLIMTQEPRYTS